MHLSKVATWWSTLVVGLLLCGIAYWAVVATLGPVNSEIAVKVQGRDPPWELLGAVVAALGGIIAISTETKDQKLPFGIAPQGIIAGAILVIGLIFTYAKAEHDRSEHEEQERQLDVQRRLLVTTSGKATKILEDMRVVNESLQKSDQAIRGSVVEVQKALGTDDKTGLRGQIEAMRRTALTADAIAAQVTPKIAAEIGSQAAPLIAKQFVLPDAKELAGKIAVPSAADIGREVKVPSRDEIASAMVAAHPLQIPELAQALVRAGFTPPSPDDLISALKASNAIPSKKDLAQAAASSLVADFLPALQSSFGREIAATLAGSPAACDALVDHIRAAFTPEQRRRILDRLGT